MKRKGSVPLFKINKAGFRKEVDHYFPKYMLTMKKQISPFIVVKGNEIRKEDITAELFQLPEDTTVFHTWPGQYRSDVFVYTIKEMREWFNAQPEFAKETYRRKCELTE